MDTDDLDEPFELSEPEYRQPQKARTTRPALRQSKPKPAIVAGELPWWARPREGFTEAAKAQQERMSSSRAGKSLGSTKFSYTW